MLGFLQRRSRQKGHAASVPKNVIMDGSDHKKFTLGLNVGGDSPNLAGSISLVMCLKPL